MAANVLDRVVVADDPVPTPPSPLRWLILAKFSPAFLAFMGGIVWAGYLSLNGLEMNTFAVGVVTGVGGVLATNLGAVLGISIAQPERRRMLMLDSKLPTQEVLQVVAAYVYVFGLFIAAACWAWLGFETDAKKVVPLLPQLSQTLLGVIVGVLAVALGLRPR